MRTLVRSAAGATVLSLALGAPAPATAAAPPAPAAAAALQAAAEQAGAERAARRAATAGLAFGRCPLVEDLPAELRCARLEVPLDYARPDGRRITLTVSRVPASGPPGSRQGSLVFNPGGPGASGMWFPAVAELPQWRRTAAAYDLVGYAPRGVGRSAPLSCRDPAVSGASPTQVPPHPTAAEKQRRTAAARAYAQGCARRAGTALPHYTTRANARDLDVLRAALGEPQLTFMGASYGTYLGAVYATLYPGRVRRMVFDSAVNPDPARVWYLNNLDQSRAFERRWFDFRAWVARHDSVYRLGRTPAAVLASYEKVRAAVARRPAGGRVGTGELQAAFLKTAYHDGFWAVRAAALSAFLAGDPGPLAEQAAPSPQTAAEDENATAVYTAVLCNDAPWPADFRRWDRDHSALAAGAPFETWANAWTNLPCAYWPHGPRPRPVDVRTGPGALPHTLIVAAERDGATPYPGALELQRRLHGAALVTERRAGSHGVAGGLNACVDRHVERYLLTGRIPGWRAACAPHPEPAPVSLDRTAAAPPLGGGVLAPGV
ncbi:alpha/beta hydrolase [Streptomyces bambusae]|uniref:alpha/beta hydrolase n=1 Tax=Streptomyces bambusae TaxID=1550616 RepID=UPI001CFC8A24|nr:alpha/beta hydrolase [Streptomyces bambusae]MCB5165562.1 alpha/beta hydrolase [Streptomyces bambusae]